MANDIHEIHEKLDGTYKTVRIVGFVTSTKFTYIRTSRTCVDMVLLTKMVFEENCLFLLLLNCDPLFSMCELGFGE